MLNISQPSLSLQLDNNIFFLHPPNRPDCEPADDPILHGILRLNLPIRRELKSLTVRLEGCYSLSIPFRPLESGKILSKQVNIDCRKPYEKGEYLFEFSLVIPSSTPPYERGRYGRVYHRVVAVAKGAGLFGGDLTVEKPVDIVVNPAPEGDVLGMDTRIEGYEEALGPYVVALRSPHLTVGGLLRASLHLSDPPPDIKIHAFSVFVVQKTTLTSRNDPSVVIETDPQRHVLIRLDKLFEKQQVSTPNQKDSSNNKGKGKDKKKDKSSNRNHNHTNSNGSGGGGGGITGGINISNISNHNYANNNNNNINNNNVSYFSPFEHGHNNNNNTPGTPNQHSIFQAAIGVMTPPSSPGYDSVNNPFNKINTNTPNSTAHVGDTLFHRTEWGALSTSRVVRLPGDSTLRPTTLPGTKNAPIRNQHEIEIRFRYELPNLGRRVFTVARDVELSSCCCRLESIILPSYDESKALANAAGDNAPPPFVYDPPASAQWTYDQPLSHSSITAGNPCVCAATAEHLLSDSNAAKALMEELASELERELQPPVRRYKPVQVAAPWAAAAAAMGGNLSLDMEMGMDLNNDQQVASTSSSDRPPIRNRSFPF